MPGRAGRVASAAGAGAAAWETQHRGRTVQRPAPGSATPRHTQGSQPAAFWRLLKHVTVVGPNYEKQYPNKSNTIKQQLKILRILQKRNWWRNVKVHEWSKFSVTWWSTHSFILLYSPDLIKSKSEQENQYPLEQPTPPSKLKRSIILRNENS